MKHFDEQGHSYFQAEDGIVRTDKRSAVNNIMVEHDGDSRKDVCLFTQGSRVQGDNKGLSMHLISDDEAIDLELNLNNEQLKRLAVLLKPYLENA